MKIIAVVVVVVAGTWRLIMKSLLLEVEETEEKEVSGMGEIN
jgi:hypothetical protein